MDILEKWDDIKNYFGRKKKKKDVKEEDPDAVLEDESPNSPSAKGSTGLIPGIKRQWVKGGAILLTLLFLLAVVYGTDMGEDEAKKDQNAPKKPAFANNEEASRRASGGTNDYQALLEQNRRRQELEAKNKPAQPAQTVQAKPQTEQQPASTPPKTYQAPTFAQPYSLPSQAPQLMADQQAALLRQEEERRRQEQEAAQKAEEDRIKNQFQSAIAFSLGGSAGGSGSSSPSDGSGSPVADGVSSGVQAAPVSTSGSYTPVSGSYTALGPRTLVAGTLIPVMLLTGINSDSPGQVMCQVQSDVYDYYGTTLLIPAGSRLLGKYESNAVTNNRVTLTFSNLQTTDGGSWSVGDSFVAVDGAGYSGIAGKLHRHTMQRISGGLLGSAIAALGSLAAGNTSSVDTYSAGQIASQGALASLIQSTSSMFNNSANVQNTVTVDPGYMFNVYVTNNITF